MSTAGVQPIMGTQIELVDKAGRGDVVLLAQNEVGYGNLSQLLSKILLSNDSAQTPACDIEDLACYSDGLILLTGGALTGFVGRPAGDGRTGWLSNVSRVWCFLPGRLYIELQRHGLPAELASSHTSSIALIAEFAIGGDNDCRFEDVS